MDGGASVADLKERISLQTNVLAKRQKLLGLKTAAGKLADDGSRIADLVVKPGTKIMMMG
jgi:ubiquitin-like domain-containing CTD phosphatase 1